MGGEYGAVRARTKLGAWKSFQAEMRDRGIASLEEQDAAGLWVIWPTNKREAKKLARADGDGWLLDYHLHT